MKHVSLDRRKLMVRLAVAATAAVLTAGQGALAQSDKFPSKTIQIVAPFPAGGSADHFARVVAQRVSAKVGVPIIIDPKPGASGIVGTRQVLASPADGYTLVSTSVASMTVPPSLVNPRPFHYAKDVAPITALAKVPSLIVAHPSLGVRTLPELVKYVRANPGKVNIASSGTGTIAHLAAEMLKREAKLDIVHVPYKGAPPALNDLLGGHAQLMFSDASFFIEHVKSGKLVPLAAGSSERIPALPDVPTTAEAGYPNLLAENVYGLFAPAGTPKATVQRLNELFTASLRDPEVKEAYARQTASPVPMTPEAFAALVDREAKRLIPLAQEVAGK
jgi:tripartite-type tricarboxylate transporter receptor subunit TctC